MPPRTIRFHPPAVAMSPAILWMLRRAFGPPGAPVSGVAPEEALALCRRFELTGRIAARQGRERLAAELGEGAAGFSRDQAGAVGMGLRLTALATRLAAVAASLDLPVVFLKFAALELSGSLVPGSRSAGDVDLLVPSAGAADFQRALLAQGFSAS